MSVSQISISSTSNKTYQICDLSILINNFNPIPSNSYIEIEIPS
jgi:hypothetical protein